MCVRKFEGRKRNERGAVKMILYEIGFEFDFFMLIPISMLIFIIIFPRLLRRGFMGKEIVEKYSEKFVRVFQIIAIVFISFFSVIVYWGQFDMYRTIKDIYDRGEYEIVEGYVENFVPMPYEGHADESFEINNVCFEYSDYTVMTGYHNAKSHGGVIRGDGQHLKIGYVYYGPEYGNIIVFIEEIL